MSGQDVSSRRPLDVGWIGASAMYLAFAAVVARTMTLEAIRPLLSWYLGLELVTIILFTAVLCGPNLPGWLLHLYFLLQATLVLRILWLRPQFDFVMLLFLPLSHQASLLFSGRMRWIWIIGFVVLTGGSLIFFLGFVKGLALALIIMAFEILIPAYLIANQELESARVESERLLGEVQETHRQLQSHTLQVEQLAAMQERNRLARELHDTVSQLIFAISLTARSAELLLERDPSRVLQLLNRLKEMSADALSQLRSLISELHPPQKP